MRLFFVIKSLGVRAGGAERVLCEIGSELARRGHAVDIATFDDSRSEDFYPLDPGVRRFRLGVGQANAPTRLVEAISRTRHLRSALTKRRPDVAIGFMISAFVPLAAAAWGTGVPVIASEHGPYARYRTRPLERLLVRALAPLCARFTVTSERVRTGFPAPIAEKMTVVANPVTLIPRGLDRSGEHRRRLLFVGNLRPEKNHATLIAAFARLAPAHPDWDLHLVGEGKLRGELEAAVRDLGLQSRVFFAGALADVSEAYAAADLFVVPSIYESFGLATAEALASRLPAVGFADCPGTNELIVDGVNGLLVAGDDRTAALAEALGRLMGGQALREKLGSAGPASVSQYLLGTTADHWEALLFEAASAKGACPPATVDRGC